MLEGGLLECDRKRKEADREHEMKSSEGRKLQQNHTECLILHGVWSRFRRFNPDMLGRRLDRNSYRTSSQTQKGSQPRLESGEERKRQRSLIIKAPRYVGRHMAVKPKHRDMSGQDSEGDHIHTANKIKTGRGQRRQHGPPYGSAREEAI